MKQSKSRTRLRTTRTALTIIVATACTLTWAESGPIPVNATFTPALLGEAPHESRSNFASNSVYTDSATKLLETAFWSTEPETSRTPPRELFELHTSEAPAVLAAAQPAEKHEVLAEPANARPAAAGPASAGVWAKVPAHLFAGAKALSVHIADKFRISPEQASRVVAAAVRTSVQTGLPASLMLAVVAVESGFKEQARNNGARGLMQIIPRWHPGKVNAIGGPAELYKVEKNIATGGAILREYIDRAGSVFSGLYRYNASAHARQYSEKVLAQKSRLDRVWEANMVATPVISLR